MIINADTKIGAILKHNPASLDAIISLSTRFRKLRNPVLRKLMANRTSIETAAGMGGCTVDDFFRTLVPLGFQPGRTTVDKKDSSLPTFLNNMDKDDIREFDVRDIIASGNDPLKQILEVIKGIEPGKILKLINTFEPVPLMKLLESKGFQSYADHLSPDLVETYFFRQHTGDPIGESGMPGERTSPADDGSSSEGFESMCAQFADRMQTIDVRHLEMPQPMLNILESLDTLSAGAALFVHHKKIPVYLLPELKTRGFDYRIKQVAENEVQLIIFPNSYGDTGK